MALSSSPARTFEERHIQPALERRRALGSLRKLTPYFSLPKDAAGFIDFSSNDYLGLAQSLEQQKKVDAAYHHQHRQTAMLGSTGSRLLTGDSHYAHELERTLAKWHKRPAALLCNSGYDANLSVVSCLSQNSTTVILDELSHNSIQMGIRLGVGGGGEKGRRSTVRRFRHNNLEDLERILIAERALYLTKPAVIVIETVYSMDGDAAPLKDILDMALSYNACVVVDEAHGLGVFGERGLGLVEEFGLEEHPSLLCSIHTFGKAAGCHGAVVCGSQFLKEFLFNYGRPIVYSTSLPMHSLVCISCSYETMMGDVGKQLRRQVMDRVELFRRLVLETIIEPADDAGGVTAPFPRISLVASISPIQALIVPGNAHCQDFCKRLLTKSKRSIRLYPIRSPTVPRGQERVRIILHSHNSRDEVVVLVRLIKSTLQDMEMNRNVPENASEIHSVPPRSRL